MAPHRAEVAARLNARIDDVADDMVAAYRTEIFPYAGIDDASVFAEVKGTSRLNVAVLLQCVSEGRALTDPELDLLRELGRRRSDQGFPLHALLRAYQVGTRVVWRHVLDELPRMSFDPDTLSELVADISSAILELTAQVSGAVSQAYLEAEREAAATEERTRRDVVEDLLAGEIESSEAARRRAGAVGFTLGSSHVAAAIGLEIAGPDPAQGVQPDLELLADALRAAFADGAHRPIVAARRGIVALVVAHDENRNRRVAATVARALDDAKLPAGVRALGGIGMVEAGVSGIHASYRQAVGVLDLVRSADGLPPVMTYEGALPYTVLRRDPSLALDAFRSSVEPLLAYDAEQATDLVRTVQEYLETGGNLAEAAKRLHVHRHTMYGRVERIEELTGRSLSDRDDVLLFELGLRALRVLPREITDAAAARPGIRQRERLADRVSKREREDPDTSSVPASGAGP